MKQYVQNKVCPEESIVKAYISIECLIFCSMYLDDIESWFNHEEHNADREWTDVKSILFIFKINICPISERKYKHMDIEERDLMHFYVLNNYEEIYHFMK